MKTYKEQFNILTEAYLQDKVNRGSSCACFVGNLLGGSSWGFTRNVLRTCDRTIPIEDAKIVATTPYWKLLYKDGLRLIRENGYTQEEIILLEREFMCTYVENIPQDYPRTDGLDEDALFIAFERTLDLLKEIHRAKGEDVDNEETPVFVKRELKPKELCAS